MTAVAAEPALAPGLPPPPRPRPALSDAATVGLAALVWLGALVDRPVPLLLVAAVGLLAVAAQWPRLLLVAGLLLASTLGARSLAGLHPMSVSTFHGTVTLLSDPVDGLGTTQADVRVGHHHVQLQVAGGDRATLAPLLAGQRITVSGELGPVPPGEPWLVPRHIAGVLAASSIEAAGPGTAPWRAANVVRRTLVRSVASFSLERRTLFTGFVLGDDRDQPASVVDDFRGSGLTHLLAVSGENVAFVLALFGPLLRRLRLGPRWAVTIGVIAFFALITRCEPSVLRASVMAGIAATAFALGRPAPGIRLLALAVSGLVLVDPLLTRSVGFQLSVAASAGILLLSPPLRRWLPGPRWLVDPLAVTIAAQAAVAPLLVSAFGGVPVSSVPANLLAAPAAGLVMTWGLGAGIPGGLLGGRVAALLQWPTAIGISWIATVARLASALPLGQLEASHLWVLGASTAALLLVARVRRVRPAESTPGAVVRSVKAACSVAIVAALLAPALALRATPPRSVAVPGGQLWRGGGGTVLVLAGAPRQAALLEQLREVGVRRIDLVVVSGSPRSGAATVALLDHRWPGGQVWATQTTAVPGAIAPAVGDAATVGTVVVSVIATSPGLAVQVRVGGAPPPTRR